MHKNTHNKYTKNKQKNMQTQTQTNMHILHSQTHKTYINPHIHTYTQKTHYFTAHIIT